MELLLVNLLVMGLASLTTGQSSSCPYAQYVTGNEQHVMCLPPNSSCNIVNKGVSAADQQLIVKLHNDLRNKVAAGQQAGANGYTLPKAADMRLLKWSDELAKIAQANADQCSTTFVCSNCRSTDEYVTGENLYYYYNQNQPAKTQWQQTINSWASGVKQMTTINYYPRRPGSFSQMAWGMTKDIGCGRTMFRGDPRTARYMDLYICIYGPAGNYINMPVYVAGEPCSDCGFGETCDPADTSAQYPDLCQAGES